jgi:hypothetical protein
MSLCSGVILKHIQKRKRKTREFPLRSFCPQSPCSSGVLRRKIAHPAIEKLFVVAKEKFLCDGEVIIQIKRLVM